MSSDHRPYHYAAAQFPLFQRRDAFKLVCLLAVIAVIIGVFVLTPALTLPMLLSVVITLLLSPIVARLERRGYNRTGSILILFGTIALGIALTGAWMAQSIANEWDSLASIAPTYFKLTMARLQQFDRDLEHQYPLLKMLQLPDSFVSSSEATGQWFLVNTPALMGQLLTCIFLVPILSFVMIRDGRNFRKLFFELVPNRIFEPTFMVATKIMTAISSYTRAKMIEASLVGIITAIGLALVGAPYAIVLGIIAGVTNILPYIGPLIGAAPGLMIVAFDPNPHPHLLWSVAGVYFMANVVDTVVIFPVVVAKLVNLHPVTVILAVIVGQKYYGLIGMLVSVPVATGFKIVFQEIYSATYERQLAPNKD